MVDLRLELRALRESNARLEQRLERMEGQSAVISARSTTQPSAAAGRPDPKEDSRVPELAVVKLKPKVDPVPRLDTSRAVVEPSPEVLDELAQVREAPTRKEEGGADPALADGQYEAGLESLRTGNLDGGVLKLQRFAQDNPRHPKADNALYFSGIGQMGQEEYAEAARTFQQQLAQYPAGDAVVDGLLKLAECRVRLNQRKEAKALYVQLISQYPGTAAASQAENRLARLAP